MPLFNPVFMEKFIPHANEYARSVIDLVTIYVSLKISLKSGRFLSNLAVSPKHDRLPPLEPTRTRL